MAGHAKALGHVDDGLLRFRGLLLLLSLLLLKRRVGLLLHEHEAVEHGARHTALVAKLVPVEGLLVGELEEKLGEQVTHVATRVARVFTGLQRETKPAELVLSFLGLAFVDVLDAQRTLFLRFALGWQTHVFAEAFLTGRVDEGHARILGRAEDLRFAGEGRRLPTAHTEEQVLHRNRDRAANQLFVVARYFQGVALECHRCRVGYESHRKTARNLALGIRALAHGLKPGFGVAHSVSDGHRVLLPFPLLLLPIHVE
mmetsp:Transcript_101245/g.290486  ORF Transcript_101245/g.290486 Transcript_101245/m.290486 type:complete len:257 (-) Transcript_101245:823-1593(-)